MTHHTTPLALHNTPASLLQPNPSQKSNPTQDIPPSMPTSNSASPSIPSTLHEHCPSIHSPSHNTSSPPPHNSTSSSSPPQTPHPLPSTPDLHDLLLRHYSHLNPPPPILSDGQLRVAYNNVNHLTYVKLESLLRSMLCSSVDVLCLVDTRIWKKSDQDSFRLLGRQLLGPGSSMHFALAQTNTTEQKGKSHITAIGGQIIIKSPRLGRVANFSQDPSGCGVVTTLHLLLGRTDLHIHSVYCPSASSASSHGDGGSLWSKLSRYIDQSHSWYHLNPTDFVLEYLSQRVQHHHAAHSSGSIIGGDFNGHWSTSDSTIGSFSNLQDWATPLHLCNPYTTLGLPSEPTLFRVDGTPVSTIDHVLHRGPSITPTSMCVSHNHGFVVADHRPLVLTVKVASWDLPYLPRSQRTSSKTTPRADIRRPHMATSTTQQQQLQRYQALITRHLIIRAATTVQRAQSYIQRLTDTAVRAARRVNKKSTKGPQGWSPTVVSLNLARTTLLEIQRRLTGSAQRSKWASASQVTQGVHHLCAVWSGHLRDLTIACKDTSYASLTDKGPSFWPSLPLSHLPSHLAREIKQLGKLLHGRHRAELQAKLTRLDRTRKQARLNGRHLSEARKLLDRGRTYWELDELIDTHGNIITDGKQLTRVATDHFDQWHAAKPTATFGFHDPACDHARLLADCDYFIAQHSTTGIPSPLLITIWTSLQAPLQTLATAGLDPNSTIFPDLQHLSATPTYADFLNTLKAMPTQSSAGPSGLTYNMIASLPTLHLRALYDHLAVLWEKRASLPTWKWRELSPLPKVLENITINDIRPLTLIETLRKVWASIIVNRIKRFWIKHSIIHPSQHAYTEARGVDTVHPQHRNLLEESRETCSSLFYTSWDIRRAFDRVAKPILITSWIRTGVPPDIANYLVEFDTQGYTFVGTPYARNILRTQGLAGFSLIDSTKTPCFQAQVGTGQGDVSSPFNWNSFFDILLRALDTVKTTPLYVRSEEHILQPTEDSGFADDLISVSARREGLQEKADVVSAFSIVFGLDIAVNKLRAVQVHWGMEDPHASQDDDILVHCDHWDNHATVPLLNYDDPRAKPIKYLGVLFDYDNSGRTQLHLVHTQVNQDFRTLVRKYAKIPLLKLEVAISCILSRARYPAKFCSWSLQDLNTIDALFSKYYRRLLSLTPSFPTELLYAPKDRVGIGLPRFSDCVNSDKLGLLHRALDSEDATRIAMQGLIYRGLRHAGHHPIPGEATHIPPTSTAQNNTLWISSLTSWLALGGLRLASGGSSMQGTSHERLDQFALRHGHHIPDEDIHNLNLSGLRTLGDVLDPHASPPNFIQHPNLPALLRLPLALTRSLPPLLHPTLKPQQSWCLHPYTAVTEVLGLLSSPASTPPLLSVRRWQLPQPHPHLSATRLSSRTPSVRAYTPNTLLHLDPCTLSMGAGTTLHLPHSDIFPFNPSHPIYHVILSPDIPRPRGQGVQRQVLYSSFSTPPLPFPSPSTHKTPTHTLPGRLNIQQHHQDIEHSLIYTDASYSMTQHPIDAFFHQVTTQPSKATAAIVFQPRAHHTIQPTTLAIRIVDGHIIPNVNPFLLETLALAVAAKLRRTINKARIHDPTFLPIHSDCKAGITLATQPDKTSWRSTAFYLLRAINRDASPDCLHWVRSHAERRTKDQSKWTQHEHGNYIADQFASDSPPTRPSGSLPTHTITAMQALQHLLLDEEWVVVGATGLPHLQSAMSTVQVARWEQYIATRDAARQLKTHPLKWCTLSLRTAAQVHLTNKLSYTECARVTKLAYDWYFHGAKMVQGSIDKYPTPLPCPLCGEDDTQYHMLCGCSHPPVAAVRTKMICNISSLMTKLDPFSGKYKCLDAIRHLADTSTITHPSHHYIWMGTWSPSQIQYLKDSLADTQFSATTANTDPIISLLRNTCRGLAQTTIAILNARQAAIRQFKRASARLYRREQRPPHKSLHHSLTRDPRKSNTPAPTPRERGLAYITNMIPTRASQRTLCTFLQPGIDNATPAILNIPSSITPKYQPRLTTFFPPTPKHTTSTHTTSLKPSQYKPLFTDSPSTIATSNPLFTPLPSLHMLSHTPPATTPLSSSHLHPLSPTPSPTPTLPTTPLGTRYCPTPMELQRLLSIRIRTDTSTILTHSTLHGALQMNVADYQRILGTYDGGWLNDTTITCALRLFNNHSPAAGSPGSYLGLDALFFTQLISPTRAYTYDNVFTWFSQDSSLNPLLYDTIFIVVNLSNSHWTGLIIDTNLRHVTYHDSIGDYSSEKNNVLYYTRRWLIDEIRTQTLLSRITEDRALTLGDPCDWTYAHNPTPSPKQTNCVDCGIFVLTTFLYHIQGRAPLYFQTHTHTLRNQLAHALLTFTLPPPHTPLSSFDLPTSSITYPSHLYLSDIPMPTLIALPLPATLLLDNRDADQDDDVIYLATRTTLHSTPSLPYTPLHHSTHSTPKFDLCAKFPP